MPFFLLTVTSGEKVISVTGPASPKVLLPIVQDGTVHRSPGLNPEGDLSSLVILNTPTYRNDLKVRKGRLQ